MQGARVTDLFVKCHLKLHIDITLHYFCGFFIARRCASADSSYGPVSVSVASRCSVETAERIELAISIGASFQTAMVATAPGENSS